ncbi:hypothetical protein [Stomatobaculum longum]|uniref:hypothetical protein n=1 Tax=Stomatobaculum longum TaxID=796942 RepID=UPI002805416A|nr:hypothetical protein [Stomatobaculum longum]
MEQEYLFVDERQIGDVKGFELGDGITTDLIEIKGGKCWVWILKCKGENEKVARELDRINKEICEKFNPTILINGCSAYFNKSLFPLINEFERKLRKLLYLASSLKEHKDLNNLITNLESKDLGSIFDSLFTDDVFFRSVKQKINKMTWNFTRDEVLCEIRSVEENVLWDSWLGKNCAETLRKNFDVVREHRNHVMHAHNIDYTQFQYARKLFNDINTELDSAIGELLGIIDDDKIVMSTQDFYNRVATSKPSLSNLFREEANDNGEIDALEMGREMLDIDDQEIIGLWKNTRAYLDSVNTLKQYFKLNREMFLAAENMRKITDQVKMSSQIIPSYIKETQEILSQMRRGLHIDKVYKAKLEKEANEDDNIEIDEKNNEESGEESNEEN